MSDGPVELADTSGISGERLGTVDEESDVVTERFFQIAGYPREITLRDGARVALKPMTPHDAVPLQRFFSRVPIEERNYLRDDVCSPEVVQRWASELDYGRTLPLLAWVDDRVVADATLHRQWAGETRQAGEVRIVVDPDYRNRGLGTRMLYDLAVIAHESGLERLIFEAVAEKEKPAIEAAQFVGFVRVGGQSRKSKALVILEMQLGKWFEWWY